MEKKTNNPAITKSYAKKMETISRTGLLPNHAKHFFCWDNSDFANVAMRFHWKKE